MVKRKQRGGNKANFDVPKPQMFTYPHGVGTAREAAIHKQNQDADMLTQVNNHTHGDGSNITSTLDSLKSGMTNMFQSGGGDCDGGHIPIPPTFGVAQGPGHMSSGNQSIGNYNSSCQAQANRVFDSLVPKPPPMPSTSQNGGKRRRRQSRVIKRKTHKRRNNRKKTHKRRKNRKKTHKRRR